MPKVTGIGGLFFRAKDTDALVKWYHTHLGIDPTPQGADEMPWMQEAGPTVFAPFQEDTEYFGPKTNQFMVNFRVDDLAGMVAQLEKAGIEIVHTEEMEGIGKFAHLFDPEGNKIELWEPAPPP